MTGTNLRRLLALLVILAVSACDAGTGALLSQQFGIRAAGRVMLVPDKQGRAPCVHLISVSKD